MTRKTITIVLMVAEAVLGVLGSIFGPRRK